MKSTDDSIRKLVRDEIHKVRPLYLSDVETAEAYGSYDQDFFAASIKKMQNYQDKHRRVFCKACVKPGPQDRLAYRRLAIELVPDLLGNDTKQVRSQCFQCDFDMYITATPELIAVGAHDEYEWNQIHGALFAAIDVGCAPDQIAHELHYIVQKLTAEHHRQATMQELAAQPPPSPQSVIRSYQDMAVQGISQGIDRSIMDQMIGRENQRNASATEARMRQELYNHQLDPSRYMLNRHMLDKGPLSSAATGQAPKRKKK